MKTELQILREFYQAINKASWKTEDEEDFANFVCKQLSRTEHILSQLPIKAPEYPEADQETRKLQEWLESDLSSNESADFLFGSLELGTRATISGGEVVEL